jgi:hypothetical protein
MWRSIDDQSYFALENVHDLLLRMPMFRHAASRFEFSKHLVHRAATRDGLALDPGTNVDPRISFFHFD